MKPRALAILLSLPLFAAGCTTADKGTGASTAEPEFAQSTGLCASPWGDLPTYRQPAGATVRSEFKPGRVSGIKGTVVVDVLVNRDGTVRDVAVVKSSGDSAVDAAAKAWAFSFRYAAKIHPDDPAPYVVPEVKLHFDQVESPGPPVSYPFYAN